MSLDRELMVAALPAYTIEGEIGRGGWGVVLSATHNGLGRRVAIKQLPRAFGADPAVRTRFKEEARLVASLTHPHIVPVFDFVEYDGLCLIVMELLTGGTLWDRFLDTGVPLDDACALMLAACTALQHAHNHGILHRDIKPENFLFADAGTMKLGDFGIAKVIGNAAISVTVAGSVMGTPAYMAPEQALGQKLGPGTDIYSIGVMLYELACGDLPFPETDEPLHQLIAKTDNEPRQLADMRPDIHPAIAEVTMKAIARLPEDRYQSARDLGMALARAATEAFGPGWLRRSGIEVMSAAEMIARTEQSTGSAVPLVRPTGLTRATGAHKRIGSIVRQPAEPREDPLAPAPPASEAPLPEAPRPETPPPAAPPPEIVQTPTQPMTPPWAIEPATPVAAEPATPPPEPSPAEDPAAALTAPAAELLAQLEAAGGLHPTSPAPATAWTDPGSTTVEPASTDFSTAATFIVPLPAFPPDDPTGHLSVNPAFAPPPPVAPSPAPTHAASPGPNASSAPTPYMPTIGHSATIGPSFGTMPTPLSNPSLRPSLPPNIPAPNLPPLPRLPPGVAGPAHVQPHSGGGRRWGLIIGIVVFLALVIAGAAFALWGRTNSNALPASTTTAPVSTTNATEVTTSADIATTVAPDETTTTATTVKEVTNPVISRIEQKTTSLVSIWWTDAFDPKTAHVLLAYPSSGTRTQQKMVLGSPQDISFTAGASFCFEIVAVGTNVRYSNAECINGADPAKVIKHDDTAITTTTAAP